MGGLSLSLFITIAIFSSIYAKSRNLNDVLFNSDYDYIDLTYPFDNDTIYWKNGQNFKFTKINENFQKDGSW